MSKLFYTVEEAASRLGMSADEVQELGASGQLQEFRDRDRLMFKKDQVDLLAGDDMDDDDAEIKLVESGEHEPISLSSSGSGSAFNAGGASGAGDTGISIFDPDEEQSGADANADTLVSGAPTIGFTGDPSASGSGLAQLTLEPDDTSLGSDLLSDLSGDSAAGASGAGASAMGDVPAGVDTGMGGSLFEGAPSGGEFAAPAAAVAPMMICEAYDGAWSGIGAGAALAATIVLLIAAAVAILGMTGSGALAGLLGGVSSTLVLAILGGGIVLVLIFAVIGWVLLKRS